MRSYESDKQLLNQYQNGDIAKKKEICGSKRTESECFWSHKKITR